MIDLDMAIAGFVSMVLTVIFLGWVWLRAPAHEKKEDKPSEPCFVDGCDKSRVVEHEGWFIFTPGSFFCRGHGKVKKKIERLEEKLAGKPGEVLTANMVPGELIYFDEVSADPTAPYHGRESSGTACQAPSSTSSAPGTTAIAGSTTTYKAGDWARHKGAGGSGIADKYPVRVAEVRGNTMKVRWHYSTDDGMPLHGFWPCDDFEPAVPRKGERWIKKIDRCDWMGTPNPAGNEFIVGDEYFSSSSNKARALRHGCLIPVNYGKGDE